MCVCLSRSVREHISRTAGSIFTKFVVQIPVAVARFSSGGVAIPGRSLMFMNALYISRLLVGPVSRCVSTTSRFHGEYLCNKT